MKKITGLNWDAQKIDTNTSLVQYRKYLERLGLKPNTIKLYTQLIKYYIEYIKAEQPTTKSAQNFYDSRIALRLSKSALNNYTAALIKYHRMIDASIDLKFVRTNNALPF
jgi:hypothetical protein